VNRDRFPGIASAGWVRLDGPAGSQVVDSVPGAIHDYLAGADIANLHGFSAASIATDRLLDDARSSIGSMLNAEREGVVFGSSMTVLAAHLADALAPTLNPGDEIVCTQLDHDANVSPWLRAAAKAGATVRFAEVDPVSLELSVEAVADQLSSRTRIVALTAASNVVGSKPDLPAIIQEAHRVGAVAVLDAVHSIPHEPLDVGSLDADVVLASAYKWFGPHLGVMWLRDELIGQLSPPKVRPAPTVGPEAWERGALPFELLPGVIGAADYMQSLDWVAAAEHEAELMQILIKGVDSIEGVSRIGQPLRGTATVAFTVHGVTPEDIARRLAVRKIAISHGNFYAVELLKVAGLQSCLRAGVLHYNSSSDVEAFLNALSDVTVESTRQTTGSGER